MIGLGQPPKDGHKRRKKLLRFSMILVLPSVCFGLLAWCLWMPGASWEGPLPELDEPGRVLRDNLQRHVDTLAGNIGERNLVWQEALSAAAAYISSQFEAYGAPVREQEFKVWNTEAANLEVTFPGTSLADEVIIVGAHYDSAPGTAGADDNASGTAALIELARLLGTSHHARTIRLVAFVNEEPPHFQSPDMGSLKYAEECRANGDNIVAMMSLESIGYYDDGKGSQEYPPVLGLLYPDAGNFIAVIGNLSSRSLVRRITGGFREAEPFPSAGLAGPEWTEVVGYSDQWSFWQYGYKGVMVTDTAFFRNPHYHKRTDTPGLINYDHLARVTRGIAKVVADLAEEG